MRADDTRTAALSSLVLQLHRGCRAWPASTFHARALELLAEVMPFTAALWGTESPATLRSVALHGHGVSQGVLADCLTSTSADPLLAAARAAPGVAVTHSFMTRDVDTADATDADTCRVTACTPTAAPGTEAHFLAASGLVSGLAVAQIEPLSKLRTYLCLWRGHEAPHFVADDQWLLQFLMPHLMETARESQLSRGLSGTEAPPAPRSHAVCDRAGVLLHLDDRCQALLRLEWPQWPGGTLPEPLLQAALKAQEQPSFVGRRIAARLAVHGHNLLLAVRLRAAQDRLSARQRGIAELYASGCTGAEIAERLGLASSTVNNHLGDIFKKLQVSSKLQLVRVLQSNDG